MMALPWQANDSQTLNAGLVALWFFRPCRSILLRTPIILWYFRGGGSRPPVHPPSGSVHARILFTFLVSADIYLIFKKKIFVSCLILYILFNNFSVMLGWVFLGWTRTKQRIKCLAKRHNTVPPARLKPATPWLWVKHSTTVLLF